MTRAQLLLLLIGLPMGELLSILLGAQYAGALATFGLIVLDVFIGSALLKKAGRIAISNLREQARREAGAGGFFTVNFISGSSRIATAGLLFIVPGFLSDILAIILLLPVLDQLLVLKTAAMPRSTRASGPVVVDLEPTDYRQIGNEDESAGKPARKRRIREAKPDDPAK